VLRAAGETETTQGNIKDWLELDEGEPGYQLLTDEEISGVISFYLFSSALPTITFSTCFINFYCLFGLSFASSILIILLIWTSFPPNYSRLVRVYCMYTEL
jgi:hypothetical protein